MALRFLTDSPSIALRWTLRFPSLAMSHMPATGVSGLDLYVRAGRGWRWCGVGIPQAFPDNQAAVLGGVPPRLRDYLLYLPLYNGVERVALGIAAGATLRPAAPRPAGRPICVYGTSIDHGGCASRPGMAWTAIAGRALDREVINLGFSGNGRMELELADLLGELDCAVFVLNCLANMNAELVTERVAPFVRRLRQRRSGAPIVLAEQFPRCGDHLRRQERTDVQGKNRRLREAFETLRTEGDARLVWVPGARLVGGDREGTVDGIHPTDLGFVRMARTFVPVLRALLAAESRDAA
jgi:lysophospholipase L1-like esterase